MFKVVDKGRRGFFFYEDREIENERSSIFIDKNLQHAETAIYRNGTESKDIVVLSASLRNINIPDETFLTIPQYFTSVI